MHTSPAIFPSGPSLSTPFAHAPEEDAPTQPDRRIAERRMAERRITDRRVTDDPDAQATIARRLREFVAPREAAVA